MAHDAILPPPQYDRPFAGELIETRNINDMPTPCTHAPLIAGAISQKGVAVAGCSHRNLSRDVGGGTGPVFDNKLLAEPFRQPLTDHSREDVVPAAGSKSDDHSHRPRRIGLRPCDARHGRQRGRARCQMQKLSAGKFHFEPSRYPSHHSITSSARARSVGGTSRPSALAVLRLMASSYLVAACTGRSAGFSPLRMRST